MKSYIFILLLIYTVQLSGNTYYVSTTGNNGNSGTIGSPWLTWQKAFSTAIAGDTVYFRGGVYPMPVTNGMGFGITNSGTYSDPICFYNYPDEIPILDGSNVYSTTGANFGIRVYNPSTTRGVGLQYIHFKGLELRNFWQGGHESLPITVGISMDGFSNVTFENMSIHNIGGRAVDVNNFDTIRVINSDMYEICDTLGAMPGNWGSPLGINNAYNLVGNRALYSYVYVYGSRSWNCSDNGFTFTSNVGYIEYNHCWSFNHGYQEFEGMTGMGCGFKGGFIATTWPVIQEPNRVIVNCISANNGDYGFSENNGGTRTFEMQMHNNFAFHNGYRDVPYQNGRGFIVPGWWVSDTLENWYRNNISYANETFYEDGNENAFTRYHHEYNSWDNPPGITVDSTDFISLDWTQLMNPRNADWSLPNITFGKLVSTSDLIDAGIDVGLPYDGSAPDLGYAEYDSGDEPDPLVIFTTGAYPAKTSCNVGGNVYHDGGSTVSARGVCWGTDADPDLTDNVVTTGSGTGTYISSISGLDEGTTYHVRAYATNDTGTSYGEDLEFTTKTTSFTKRGAKWVFYNGKWIRI